MFRTIILATTALLSISCMAATPTSALANGTAAEPLLHIEGPITNGTRGYPYATSIVDLKPYGYTEKEYFISGNAHPFLPAPGTTLAADGRWQVVPGAETPYKTRILVRMPPAARFNGTVVVEWMQEYFGYERDTSFRWDAATLLRQGYGWVGVSLQHEGIDDPTPPQTFTFGTITFTTGMTLHRWDSQRYGSLTVPSTDLGLDILTQVGRAIGPDHAETGVDPFPGYNVRRLIAIGDTEAASHLAFYVNAVQPQTHVFDGFLLKDLVPSQFQLAAGVSTPTAPPLRTDVDVPVIMVDTETAAVQLIHQPEGPKLRVWEPAGSSHTTGAYMALTGKASARDFGVDPNEGLCPIGYANSFPLQYITGAALTAVNRWAKTGVPAPSFPQFIVTGTGQDAVTPFDKYGNSAGGMRNPWVDVPIARYDWRGPCVGGSGRTYPFSAAQLTILYGTPQNYHAKFEAAVHAAEKKDILLPEDAKAAIVQADSVSW
jgi:hypothetical protein